MKVSPVVQRWIGNCFLIVALAIAAWLIWLEWGTSLIASSQQERLVAEVREELASASPSPDVDEAVEDPVIQVDSPEPLSSDASEMTAGPSVELELEPEADAVVVDSPQGESGEAFGVITVPRFGDDFMMPILYDTDVETLKYGVGYYLGTGAPCAVGNFAIAGHRTTYGRPFHDIDRLQPGDEIIIETTYGNCVYQVDSHEIVTPSDVRVLEPVPNRAGVTPEESWLTMTACHPKYSDAERYVVFARLTETN